MIEGQGLFQLAARSAAYAALGSNKAVLTATSKGRSTITMLNLATGKRTALRTGSQPTVAG